MNQEALLPFDNHPPSYNINQNSTNLEKNNQNTLTLKGQDDFCYLILIEIIMLFICMGIATLLILLKYLNWALPFIAWAICLTILWTVGYGLSVRKIEFFKNEYTNKLTLTIQKKFCCSKKYTIMLENTYVFYEDYIFILNTLKNSREFDLDNSNIKNYPINLISKYGQLKMLRGSENEIQLKIDEFLKQEKYENNIYDEINKYIILYKKNYLKDTKKVFDIYMKINDYFYTYFYSNDYVDNRTDFIYSNDFERLFIGKIYKNTYNKSLVINLNEIIRFEIFEIRKSGVRMSLHMMKII